MQDSTQGQPPPTGIIRPTEVRAVRAFTALDVRRLSDAAKHIESLPDSSKIDRAWKSLLSGLLALRREASADAEKHLREAASMALMVGMVTEDREIDSAPRLAALAYHHLGWLYRRQDRPDAALSVHQEARRLRERHGSFEEQWETAVELGMDAGIARRYDEAHRWYRTAIDLAERASEDSSRESAVAWTLLSSSLLEYELHDEAVTAARKARDAWQAHDVGAVETARADLILGGALLGQGEAFHGCDDELAKSVLDEATQLFSTAYEAFLAFGTGSATDARLSLEQRDFAQRLIATIGEG